MRKRRNRWGTSVTRRTPCTETCKDYLMKDNATITTVNTFWFDNADQNTPLQP